jgi:hypothetical protein
VGSANTAKFIAAVDAALCSGWSRRVEEEASANDSVADEHAYYVCEPTPQRPRALLAIYRKDKTTFYVSNIVPAEVSELSHDQYNAILLDFHDHVLRKLSTDFPVTMIASGDQRRLEDILSPEAMTLLKRFCGLANKSTGSAHPMDRERWYDFLIMVGNQRPALTAHDVMRWLTEVDAWPARTAQDLVIEFEFAFGLLARLRAAPRSVRNQSRGRK